MKEFVADQAGIGPSDTGDRIPWGELADMLATQFNPFSSASLLRKRLVDLIGQDQIEGDVEQVKALLAATGGDIKIRHPEWTNEEIASITGGRTR